MKQLLLLLTAVVATGLSTRAQQPEQADSTLQTDITAYLIAHDSVFRKAMAHGEGLNFRVFGSYARNDAYYDRLAERFEQADTTLFGSDFLVLYYGYVYRDEYNGGYGSNSWTELMNKEQYEEAYEMLLDELKENPAAPYMLRDAVKAGRAAGRPEVETEKLIWRFLALQHWMGLTGNGTKEYPVMVVNVQDEYAYMYEWLGIEAVTSQSLINNDGTMCDRMSVTPGNNSWFSGSEVWFDITYPLPMLGEPGHWAKKLENGTDTNEKN